MSSCYDSAVIRPDEVCYAIGKVAVIKLLQNIWNMPITELQCYSPDAWCPAQSCVLVPVVKTGNVSNIENYRPIALARILSKVLQLILLDRFQEYLATTEHQFGFKNKHRTINRGKLFMKQFLFIW